MRLNELNPGQKKEFTPSNTKESHSFTTFLNQCSESIAACREAKGFLYRGMYNDHDIFLGRPRQNRKAKDTSRSIQKEWDKLFSEAGFTALRSNSIFCCGNKGIAESYGDAYIIFPINGFSFTWSPKITDLYDYMQRNDINNSTELYISLDNKKKITSIANKMSRHVREIGSSRETKLEDKLYDLCYDFESIIYESSITTKTKILQKISASINNLEKIYKVNLYIIHNAIKKIQILLNDSIMTPDQVIEKYAYTNKNFAAALKSKKEVIIDGEYYAFAYSKYYPYLSHALLGIGKAPDPSKFFNNDDYYCGYD